ncbi:hypothetical protein KX729_05380 [Rhizobium sp. XQZ8]|uniref:hypothetical protein n=1 Tax=Rhizobium populisoli TaxID=2859785 RepID=UPI001CA57CC9|nr:hypothetical protein [Rhizobium populisoli]MBW6420866.1 hypothetical protein [Rhizobium populisoli]
MSRLAALLMFVAWLLYGAMPAIGMPYMAAEQVPAIQDHSGGHDHGKMAEATQAEHSHGSTQQPCPHGGKTCVTPFCAACLTLIPEIDAGDKSPFVHAYPAPGIELVLVYPAPAPLTPPPRA